MSNKYREIITNNDIEKAAAQFQCSTSHIYNIINGYRTNLEIETFVLDIAKQRTEILLRELKYRLKTLSK